MYKQKYIDQLTSYQMIVPDAIAFQHEKGGKANHWIPKTPGNDPVFFELKDVTVVKSIHKNSFGKYELSVILIDEEQQEWFSLCDEQARTLVPEGYLYKPMLQKEQYLTFRIQDARGRPIIEVFDDEGKKTYNYAFRGHVDVLVCWQMVWCYGKKMGSLLTVKQIKTKAD